MRSAQNKCSYLRAYHYHTGKTVKQSLRGFCFVNYCFRDLNISILVLKLLIKIKRTAITIMNACHTEGFRNYASHLTTSQHRLNRKSH